MGGVYGKSERQDEFRRDRRYSNPVFDEDTIVANKYLVSAMIGMGSYGQVFEVRDTKTGQAMALKVCTQRGYNYTNNFCREVSLTASLSRDDSKHRVVGYIDKFKENNFQCMVMKLERCSLSDYITNFHPDPDVITSPVHIRRLAKSLLLGLQYLEQKQVLHADLKTNNILIDHIGECVIADFGLARRVSKYEHEIYSRIQHVHFRAPEIILRCSVKGYGIDMWAAGIILVHIAAKILFYQMEQTAMLANYSKLLGKPSDTFLNRCLNTSEFFEMDRDYPFIASDRRTTKYRIWNTQSDDVLPLYDLLIYRSQARAKKGFDKPDESLQIELMNRLLGKMLEWDPKLRVTPTAALNDLFFDEQFPINDMHSTTELRQY